MFAVSDVVEVVHTKTHHEYRGRIGVITAVLPNALGSRGNLYLGYTLSPDMKNSAKQNIAWRPEQLRKINPPDVDLKVEEMEHDRV